MPARPLYLISRHGRPVCATWATSAAPTRIDLDDTGAAPLYGRRPGSLVLCAEDGWTWRRTTHAYARRTWTVSIWRVRLDEDGDLDEVFAADPQSVHLEVMDDHNVSIIAVDAHGVAHHIDLTSRGRILGRVEDR